MIYTAQTSLGEKIYYDGTPIATGGNEGAVYKITYPSHLVNYCLKIYHIEKRTKEREKKIGYMVHNRPGNLENERFKICWPAIMIFEIISSKFIGFLMLLAYPDSIRLSELTRTNFSPKLGNSWKKFDRTTIEGSKKRLLICVNIAGAVYKLHSTGKYVIVDYKPENVLISLDGKVSIIDVDSFQIAENSNVLYHSEVLTPEYKPREGKVINPASHYIPETWDRFSLAVSFYQILFGIHPFSGTPKEGSQYENVSELEEKIQRGLFAHGSKKSYFSVIPPPHKGFNNLSPVIQRLFIETFEDGHTNPNVRPSAENWGKIIYRELNKKTAIQRPLEDIKAGRSGIYQNNAVNQKPRVPQQTQVRQPFSLSAPQAGNRAASVANTTNPNLRIKQPLLKKKENYMPWKIASIIFIIAAIWLYLNYTSLKQKLSETNTELTDAKTTNNEMSSIQNKAEGLKEELSESYQKLTRLQNKLELISKDHPLTIKSITFSNESEEGIPISSAADKGTFSQSELVYIAPVIKFDSNLEQDTIIIISYEILDPENKTLNPEDDSTSKCEVRIKGFFKQGNIQKLCRYHINSDNPETRIPIGQYKINIWFNNNPIFQGGFEIIN